jgi:propionyl-CoA carboxylase alpha chain
MLAKVIAHGPTRAAAAAKLASGLERSRIHGVTTNRDLLVRILREDEFLAGGTDTAYLDRHEPADLARPLLDDAGEVAHSIAAVIGRQARNRAAATVQDALPSGWRNNPSQPQRVVLAVRGVERSVGYAFGRGGSLTVTVDDEPVEVTLHSAAYHVVDATVDGVRRRYRVVAAPGDGPVDVDSPLGSSSYDVVPRFPDPLHAVAAGSLVAPMPGAVVRVLVDVGSTVTRGQPLVVLEAMKMEHTVASPSDGTVAEISVSAGQQVDAGAVLAVVHDGSEPGEG